MIEPSLRRRLFAPLAALALIGCDPNPDGPSAPSVPRAENGSAGSEATKKQMKGVGATKRNPVPSGPRSHP